MSPPRRPDVALAPYLSSARPDEPFSFLDEEPQAPSLDLADEFINWGADSNDSIPSLQTADLEKPKVDWSYPQFLDAINPGNQTFVFNPQESFAQGPSPLADTSMPPPSSYTATSPTNTSYTGAGSPTPSSKPSSRKRKASSPSSVESVEEAARQAAEEDKRRRNTAASARFRVKKKQREEALQRHAEEMKEKCQKLEERVRELETQNGLLKNLVLQKKEASAVKAETA